MNKFKPSLLTLSLLAAGMSFSGLAVAAEGSSTTEQAQTETQTEATTEKPIEAIAVRGFRGSVIKALNTKRFSDTVVDAISADDIGGLPDVSIADALTRMPGVTSIRIDGQSSELNIRGLGGGFVFSTFNGREQVSSAGGRSVQFDQFPAELIKQAQVYKSQKASLIEGGVAGTVELQTANALDNEEDSSFRFSAHGNWNDVAADNEDAASIGHRLTASFQQKFLDETLGISGGYARMFQPTVSSRFVNNKFEKRVLSNFYDGAPEGEIFLPTSFEINERGGEDTRDAFVFGLNWAPRDDFRLQTDAFYSQFDSKKWDRGLRVAGLNNVGIGGDDIQDNSLLLSNPVFQGDTLIGGTFTRDPNGTAINPPFFGSERRLNVQTQADDNSTDSTVFSFGIKAEWDITDRLAMTVDVAHSEADETYLDRVMRLSLFQDASVETPIIDDDIVLNYQLNGQGVPDISLNKDFTDLSKMMVTSAESYPHIEDNSADAFKIDFSYQLENDYFRSVEAGVRVSSREYQLRRGRFLYGTTDFNMRNGQYIVYDQNLVDADGNPIEIERFAPFRLTEEFAQTTQINGELSGMPNFLSVSNDQILNAWIPGVDQTPIRTWEHNWTMSQGNIVEEDVTAGYFMANLDTQVGSLPVTGNIGIRIVRTDQKSTGLLNVGPGNGQILLDDRGVASDEWVLGTEGVKYTDYLPSLNLNFSLTDSDQLRFAFAKVMSRPDMSKMANSGNFRWDQGNDGALISLDSSTSPLLKPFYAKQYDISYEHYFAEGDGAIVFALWNKDIDNLVETTSTDFFDFAAAGIEVPPTPPKFVINSESGLPINWQNGNYKRAANNADAGYIRGIEFAYTQTFSFLPGAWKGLGVNLTFSYTESEIETETGVPGEEKTADQPAKKGSMKGLSPRVYTATIFYDYDEKLNTRISARHRASYLSEQIAVGSNEPAHFTDETIVSAQMSYNVTENLQAVVSVDNLTDEPNSSYFRGENQSGTTQYFGRTFYFGFNYKI